MKLIWKSLLVVGLAALMLIQTPAIVQAEESSSWSDFVRVNDITTGATMPLTAMNDKGMAMVVWGEEQPGNQWSVVSRVRVGEVWGEPEYLQTMNAEMIDGYLVMDDYGNALMMWTVFWNVGWTYSVMGAHYTHGQGWGMPTIVRSLGADETVHNMDLAVDASGNFVAIFLEYHQTGNDPATATLRGITYSPNSGWGTPSIIDTKTGNLLWMGDIDLALNDEGYGFACWDVYNDATSEFDIFVADYAAGPGWGQPERVATSEIMMNTPGPMIAMMEDGSATVAWLDGSGISVRSYVPSEGWGFLIPIFTNGTDPQDLKCFVIDDEGTKWMTWFSWTSEILVTKLYSRTNWNDTKIAEEGLQMVGNIFMSVPQAGPPMLAYMESTVGPNGHIVIKELQDASGWTNSTIIDDNDGIPEFSFTMNAGGDAVLAYWSMPFTKDFINVGIFTSLFVEIDGSDTVRTSDEGAYVVQGNASQGKVLSINGNIVQVYNDGTFRAVVPLNEGDNSIVAILTDPVSGHSAMDVQMVSYQNKEVKDLRDQNTIALGLATVALILALIVLIMLLVQRKKT